MARYVGGHTWPPSELEERDRRARITALLRAAFDDGEHNEDNQLREYPAELRDMITAHLLSEYSACEVGVLCTRPREDDLVIGRLGHEVWAEHVKLNGRWYVSRLTNTKREGKDYSIPLPIPPRVHRMHIAIDYLGVCCIILEDSCNKTTEAIEPEPGIWWQTIRIPGTQNMALRSDVSRRPPCRMD